MWEAQVPREPLRDPSEASTKDPVVMCDIGLLISVVDKHSAVPRIHFSDEGSVHRCLDREELIGGDVIVVVFITSQKFVVSEAFPLR